ncbi:cation transporter [Candidatus Gracilibacteria bacterium]|nr:cation transporter [Candidatus Gracilibacteria bacterium]
MKIQQKATIIATTTAFFLAILKLTIGIFSGSIAILASAIDSLLDMGISIFNFVAVKNSGKDPDDQFNYGRGKIEALAAFLEGIIIAMAGIFIAYESVSRIIYQKPVGEIGIGVVVMVISVIVTGWLVGYLESVAKKTKSIVIASDALHYKTDLLSNLAILVGLILVAWLGWNYIDAIIGIGIAIYIAFSAFDIVKKGFLLLLDVSLDEMHVVNILDILDNHKELSDYHNFRSRESGGVKFVEAHLVFHENISLLDAHRVSHEIEDEIRKLDTDSEWSILFHLDPYDDKETDK